jgi:hypothetical protein
MITMSLPRALGFESANARPRIGVIDCGLSVIPVAALKP